MNSLPMSQRLVRFQQFLPLQPQENNHVGDGDALFSPSLPTGSYTMLHSVFSPNFNSLSGAGGGGGNLQPPAPVTSTKKELQTPGKKTRASRTTTTPMNDPGTTPFTPAVAASFKNSKSCSVSSSELFFSPEQQSLLPSATSKRNTKHNTNTTPVTSSPPLFSPYSAISRGSQASAVSLVASFPPLPTAIDMLSLAQIQHSHSVPQLSRTVQFLTDQQRYRGLLRAAQKRLDVIQQEQQQNASPKSMAARSRATVPPPLPSNSYNNESSSLVMSLSSDEESKVDLSHHYCVSSAASPANSVVPVGISLLPPTPRSLLPSAPVNRASSSPRQKQQQPPTTGKLQAPNKGSVGIEVQRLTKMIVELEKGRLADQTAFWERWKELQDAKAQAEEGIQALHGVLTSSKEATTELVKALEALREENHSIHMELTRERKARAQQNREAIELERQLTAKVEQLTQQLAQVEQQQQSSQQTASLDQKNRELNRMLRSAQRNLLEIKKERDTMIRAVLDAAGRKDTEIKQLSKDGRHQLVSGIAKLTASSHIVTESTKEAARAMEAQQLAEARLKATTSRLEDDNFNLTKQIQCLSDKLTASRTQAEQLMKSVRVNHQERWEKQEANYKQVIHGLKQKLRTEDTTVSIRLYRSAVDEVKAKAAECKTHSEKVASLQTKLTQLEQQLQVREPSSDKKKPSALKPSAPRAVPGDEPKAACNEANDENVAPPKTPKPSRPKVEFKLVPIAKSESRWTTVRAVGGRKGLQEKLNQVRSPRRVALSSRDSK